MFADVRRFVVGTLDKIAEARFFLEKVATANRYPDVDYYVSAFNSACYSMRLQLIHCSEGFPEAERWWKEKLEHLKASPMGAYFHDGRNDDVHKGFSMIDRFGVKLIDVNGELVTREHWAMRETASYSPGAEAEECREYFESMARLALDGYRRFARLWDPQSAYAPEFERIEREDLRPIH